MDWNEQQVQIAEKAKEGVADMFEEVGLFLEEMLWRGYQQVSASVNDIMDVDDTRQFEARLVALYMCGVTEAVELITGKTPVLDGAARLAEMEES